MSALRRRAAEGGLRVGDRFVVERTFTAEEIARFAALTRDYNPVHFEPEWCAAKGFAGPLCHGLLVGSMICEPGGQLAWLASSMSFRFRAPVYAGDTITCALTIVEIDEDREGDRRRRARAECVLTNQHGEVVLTGDLRGHLPGPEEQGLLARILERGDPTNPLNEG